MTKYSSDPGFLKIFSELEKEQLKQLAVSLEAELKLIAHKSKDMKQLSEFPGLLDAIKRAQLLQIARNERVVGMEYFYLHSDMPEYRSYLTSLSSFELLLEGFDLPEP